MADSTLLDKIELTRCPVDVRAGFIKKVYALVTCQILLTAGLVSAVAFTPGVAEWVRRHPELGYIAMVASLFFLCSLTAVQDRYPINLLLMLLITFCEACAVGTICVMTRSPVVVPSLVLAVSIFGGLSLYVHCTRRDLSALDGGVCAGLSVVLALVVVGMLFPSYLMQAIVGGAGVLLASAMVLYDTSLLLHRFTPDDAVVAAVQLYLDLVNMFLYLLQFLDACESRH